jgi:flagellar protein FliS
MLAASYAKAVGAYQQINVQSRSALELVVMLYDGAVRFSTEARVAVDGNNPGARRQAVSRALAVVGELQNSLNMAEGGDIAKSLDGLYTYISGRLVDGNIRNDAGPFDEVVRLLKPLREAWGQIAVPGAGTRTT